MTTNIITSLAGRTCEPPQSYRSKSASNFFSAPQTSHAFQASTTFETDNIQDHYENENISFTNFITAFISYNIIQIAKEADFAFLNMRHIDNQWYIFDRLPLTMSIKQESSSSSAFEMANPTALSWVDFLNIFVAQTTATQLEQSSYFSHQMFSVPFDFKGSIASQSAQQTPCYVISQKNPTCFGLSYTVPRELCTPVAFNRFSSSLRDNLEKTPLHRPIHAV